MWNRWGIIVYTVCNVEVDQNEVFSNGLVVFKNICKVDKYVLLYQKKELFIILCLGYAHIQLP